MRAAAATPSPQDLLHEPRQPSRTSSRPGISPGSPATGPRPGQFAHTPWPPRGPTEMGVAHRRQRPLPLRRHHRPPPAPPPGPPPRVPARDRATPTVSRATEMKRGPVRRALADAPPASGSGTREWNTCAPGVAHVFQYDGHAGRTADPHRRPLPTRRRRRRPRGRRRAHARLRGCPNGLSRGRAANHCAAVPGAPRRRHGPRAARAWADTAPGRRYGLTSIHGARANPRGGRV